MISNLVSWIDPRIYFNGDCYEYKVEYVYCTMVNNFHTVVYVNYDRFTRRCVMPFLGLLFLIYIGYRLVKFANEQNTKTNEIKSSLTAKEAENIQLKEKILELKEEILNLRMSTK